MDNIQQKISLHNDLKKRIEFILINAFNYAPLRIGWTDKRFVGHYIVV